MVLPVYRMTSVLAHNENTAGRFSEALGRNSFSLSLRAYSSCYKHILPEERYKLQTVSWDGVFRVDKSLVAISTVTTTSWVRGFPKPSVSNDFMGISLGRTVLVW